MVGCLNCNIFKWEEGRIDSHVQESSMRCQKCKMAYYCGRDCQVEHWEKVHKKKCKYYRGDKEQVEGVHRHLASMCNNCKEEQDIVEGQWGCHMQKIPNFWNNPAVTITGFNGEQHRAPLAVELGELTGNFSSRLEHVVSVLQRILHKMDLNGHPLSRKDQFINLTREVFKLRCKLLEKSASTPSSMVENPIRVLNIDIMSIIQELSNQYEDDVNEAYRLWDTFTLIYECFFSTENYLLMSFEDWGFKVKDKTVKKLFGEVEKSLKMEEKWDKLGSVLSSGPVPYLTILEIIIESLGKKCSSCKENVIIRSTYGYYPDGSGREKIPNVLGIGNLLRFHCGKLDCMSEVVDTFLKDERDMWGFLLRVMKDYIGKRCDWCFKFKKSVHRCRRCLTKVYCSEECANMDWWKVHKEVCKEKPDSWKQKGTIIL